MHRRPKTTQTPKRNQVLFTKYLHIIKRDYETFGSKANNFSVRERYAEVADLFHISIDQAGRIICRMLKERNAPDRLTPGECNEMLKDLEDLHTNSIEKKVNDLNKILLLVGVQKTHEEVRILVQEYLTA